MQVQLIFPVMCFNQDIFRVEPDEGSLTTCNKKGLENGWYNNMLLVDVTGRAIIISHAKKLHGIGLFRGYNIFLNQQIKVELCFSGEPFQISLEELKERIFTSFKEWHGWEAGGDLEEIREKVSSAASIREVFDAVSPPARP